MVLAFIRAYRDKEWATISGEMCKLCGVVDPFFCWDNICLSMFFSLWAVASFLMFTTFGLHLHFAADWAAAFWKSQYNCLASVGSHQSSRRAS